MKFRVLTIEGKQPIAIKKGYCWPAFVFGVFWAWYKRFWPAAGILFLVAVVFRGLPRVLDLSDSYGLRFVISTLFLAAIIATGYYAKFASDGIFDINRIEGNC